MVTFTDMTAPRKFVAYEGDVAKNEVTKRPTSIALKDAVGLGLVVVGGIGAPVCAGALWGVWGVFLALFLVCLCVGLAIGLSE